MGWFWCLILYKFVKKLIMKSCPKCKSEYRTRVKRKTIVKMIPGTRSYICDKCNTSYTWFSFLNFSLKI